MKHNSSNPQSLFQKTKEWIAFGQKANMDRNIAIAESSKTPLNLLIDNVKADTPKYIKRLKVATAAAMVAGGNFTFNPNIAGANKTESSAASKTEMTKSDSIVDFTNSVFTVGGKYNSMSKGGTPIAIKRALQNDQRVTSGEIKIIFEEAAQINNGKTNPINQKEVKIKMSYYNNYINQGMNPSEALFRATITCQQNNPELFKNNEQDIKTLETIAQNCSGTNKEVVIKTTYYNYYINKGLNHNDAILKAKIKCQQKYPDLYTNQKQEYETLLKLTKTCSDQSGKNSIQTQTPLQTLKEQNQIPKVAPSILPTIELKPKSPEKSSENNSSESRHGFDYWVKDNQKSIDDFLKVTGMLTIAGLATAAGLAAIQKMYKKYQQWEATLPPMMTRVEAKANFWTNMEKFKQSDIVKKIKNQTQKTEKATQRLVRQESVLPQSQTVETNSNTNELRPGIGQMWSSFIRGFREKFVKNFEFTKSKLSNVRQFASNFSLNTKARIQENFNNVKSTIKGVNDSISQKIETRKTNIETKKANQQGQQEQAQKQEAEKNQAANELCKQRAETIAKMENFEIPFVAYKEHKDSEDYLNRFVITPEMLKRENLLNLTDADCLAAKYPV